MGPAAGTPRLTTPGHQMLPQQGRHGNTLRNDLHAKRMRWYRFAGLSGKAGEDISINQYNTPCSTAPGRSDSPAACRH